MGKSIIVAVMAIAVLLAGCGGSSSGNSSSGSKTGTSSTTISSSTSSSSTTGCTPACPTAHDLGLTADKLSGVVPLNVTFTVTGGSSDGSASWLLDFGDGSQNAANPSPPFPATISHRYTSAANLTAAVKAVYSDHSSLTKSLNLTLTGTGGGPPPAGLTLPFLMRINKAGTYGAPYNQFSAPPGFPCGGKEGSNQVTYPLALNATIQGVAVKYTHATFNLTLGNTNQDSDLFFLAPDGTVVDKSTNANGPANPAPTVQPVTAGEQINKDGPFDAGAYSVQVQACNEVNGTFTLEGWVRVEAA